MIIIALIARGFGWLGFGAKAARVLAWLVAGIVVCAIVYGIVAFTVDKIGDWRENKLALEAANKTIVNTAKADKADKDLENKDLANDARVEGAINDAKAKHPEAATRSSGPAAAAAYDELRRQRQGTAGQR